MSLPPDGPLTLAGIDVGDGRRITPDPAYASSTSSGPVLWLGTTVVKDAAKRWSALRLAFPKTGLWPLLLGGLEGEPDRPWVLGELNPTTVVAGKDEQTLLADCWASVVPTEFEEEPEMRKVLEPFGEEFPGLASVSGTPRKDDVIEGVAKEIAKGRRLGLVEVSRPADVVAMTGWEGPVNAIDSGSVSAILRSWEERFAVVVVGLEFDTLTLAVRRPPVRQEESLRVAAEHYAFCFDNIMQGAGSIKAYAKLIEKRSRWDFWWD